MPRKYCWIEILSCFLFAYGEAGMAVEGFLIIIIIIPTITIMGLTQQGRGIPRRRIEGEELWDQETRNKEQDTRRHCCMPNRLVGSEKGKGKRNKERFKYSIWASMVVCSQCLWSAEEC
jgi:hypothetical protein